MMVWHKFRGHMLLHETENVHLNIFEQVYVNHIKNDLKKKNAKIQQLAQKTHRGRVEALSYFWTDTMIRCCDTNSTVTCYYCTKQNITSYA